MMQTATADISNPVKRKIQNVRMLLDSGSQITYIAEALAKLKRGVKTEIMVTTFGSKKNTEATNDIDHNWHPALRRQYHEH